ncbi:glycoside hydrolase family 3 protein [Microbacterium sp. EYE_5]|uniref:glycoside hydrolase family 3 protein n=1 Tax=unclassified Microbacterium TaxID=2609290 RepID=UPI0020055A00|nr:MULTISPECIES: glycoside hydrolase family 3 N-terminal domain-containing protein [unclassified Microbacterium]MCK6079423.1 glycoside hydrolase family 3 protein [Microbacterium sp. EYE_382]MCK6084693.1 glycoside hydrolase family 3 protein [Microbacterium sp. EYE_384]MCK6123078.1 glycoside hydrolase family 3 protein [Microbacterium sp. EYE_80]MCK6125457.1 glycoside hydrolase family 3 protein [Microbacterium sp. EYE_79]MCK6140377.1 glycoside hydrolase family 3 protein [Microbacterium sp. EYE_39
MTAPDARLTPDGTVYRDLNGNGEMDVYEDPRRTPEERTDDLLGRLSLPEKIGLMFQTVIEAGPNGALLEAPGKISKSATTEVVVDKHLTHFNVHGLSSAHDAARWNNALQRLAASNPHGIPVTISTDPRHAFVENAGASFAEGPFSKWPDALGLAALDDPDTTRRFAEIAREEYRAVGIRSALHPQIDLATEPRWCRQLQTFGSDPSRVSVHTAAYLRGFQGAALDADSVSCVTKHFPGGGPQKDGEDAHFPYGREQVYPGAAFDDHLAPFVTAIANGTAGIMPYYGMPIGLTLDGEEIEEVGFGYNRQIVQGLLRERLGYQGVVVTDWELVNDNHVDNQVLPARAWGVEHLDASGRMRKILDAGADQFGGEECVELLAELIEQGLVAKSRVDESARRILLVKFQLGLFDDPFVDELSAAAIVGDAEHRAEGENAQARSVVILENGNVSPVLPVRRDQRIFVQGIDHEVAARYGEVVATPAEADVALVRIAAPYEPRDDLFLEAYFHQGSLEFRPGLVYALTSIAAEVPLIVDVQLDRAAVLTPIGRAASGLTVTFGVSDEALLRAWFGEVAPVGILPIALPRSMDAVRAVESDAGLRGNAVLYPLGHGLRLDAGDNASGRAVAPPTSL